MASFPVATFLAGVGVGLTVAVPIGPMGLLCIQRTLAFGLVAGLATGLAAATVHLMFGAVAALGLGSAMQAYMSAGAQVFALVSAGLLFWFAIRVLCRSAMMGSETPPPETWLRSFGSAFALGLANPITVLLFLAALPALATADDLKAAPLLITGVFLGSIGWWILLSTTVSLIRRRLSARALNLTNRASGLTLAALGTLMLANAFGLTLN
jgi:threonine/homoserine/homoserine lactone efflux protein